MDVALLLLCQRPAAVLRTARMLALNINHRLRFSFPAFALPQSRSYQLHSQMKEGNSDGVIYFVNQKKGSCSIILKKNHGISP